MLDDENFVDWKGGKNNDVKIGGFDFFNEIVLPGNVPVNVCPAFYGAKMFGLSKKDGGIRPIAVGCSLRRIAAKLCMHKV